MKQYIIERGTEIRIVANSLPQDNEVTSLKFSKKTTGLRLSSWYTA